ncbi:MAG: hypothetical protein FJ096_14440 [Deltaproteobacteria bacterium]|nr:hypothetical protein [Deltaproteobacteria bacterium]
MRPTTWWSWLGAAGLAVACSNSKGDLFGGAAAVATGVGGGTPSSSSSAGGGTPGAGGSLTVVGAGGSTCEPTCSADLKRVIG